MAEFYIDNLCQISSGSILLDSAARLGLCSVLAYILGSERSTKQKVAGVRTHCLLADAACLATLAGPLLAVLQPVTSQDPTRLAGQILTGIGFVGAGAIVRRGYITVGLTTAGTIFLAACVGVACGLGFPSLAAIVLVMLALTGRAVEVFRPEDEAPSSRFLKLKIRPDDLQTLRTLLPQDAKLRSIDQTATHVELVVVLKSRSFEAVDQLIDTLAEQITLKGFEVQSY